MPLVAVVCDPLPDKNAAVAEESAGQNDDDHVEVEVPANLTDPKIAEKMARFLAK